MDRRREGLGCRNSWAETPMSSDCEAIFYAGLSWGENGSGVFVLPCLLSACLPSRFAKFRFGLGALFVMAMRNATSTSTRWGSAKQNTEAGNWHPQQRPDVSLPGRSRAARPALWGVSVTLSINDWKMAEGDNIQEIQSNVSFLEPKPLGFIPIWTLCFLNCVLVSFQCLGVLLFRCMPSHECLLDHFN